MHSEPRWHLRREGKQRVVFVILSHYFSPSPATFLKSLLLEDASYFLANTHLVPQGCVQEAACVRLPPVVCQRGSARKGRKQGKEERKTCMFDQRGAESRRDGSGDQGFATKLREERLKETFEERCFCFQSVFKGTRADSALRHS